MKKYLGKFISLKYRDRKEIIRGYLIDFNEKWTLLKYNPADYIIDGYRILKTNRILKYKRDADDEFREKVLIMKGLVTSDNDKFPLTDIFETLKIISERFEVFAIEIKDPTVCYIGRLKKVTKNHIIIEEISTKAEWIYVDKYSFKKIRYFDFDNDYNNSLVMYNKMTNI